MKNPKKIVLVFIGILIVVLVIILVMLLVNNRNKSEFDIEEVYTQSNKIKKIDKRSDYFNVKDCINIYKEYSIDREMNKYILNIIPDFVKKDLEINIDNIADILLPNKIIRIDNIYISKQTISKEAYNDDTNICAYIVNGVLIDETNSSKKNFNMVVLLDEINYTFYIIPQQYIEKHNINLKENNNIELYTSKSIKNNLYNTFKYSTESAKDLGQEYFNRVKIDLIYDLENIYNLLDSEYKEKNFGNYQEFEAYIKSNEDIYRNNFFSNCYVKYFDEYVQYTCTDINGNIFTFNEKSPLDITLTIKENLKIKE